MKCINGFQVDLRLYISPYKQCIAYMVIKAFWVLNGMCNTYRCNFVSNLYNVDLNITKVTYVSSDSRNMFMLSEVMSTIRLA